MWDLSVFDSEIKIQHFSV